MKKIMTIILFFNFTILTHTSDKEMRVTIAGGEAYDMFHMGRVDEKETIKRNSRTGDEFYYKQSYFSSFTCLVLVAARIGFERRPVIRPKYKCSGIITDSE